MARRSALSSGACSRLPRLVTVGGAGQVYLHQVMGSIGSSGRMFGSWLASGRTNPGLSEQAKEPTGSVNAFAVYVHFASG